MYTIIPVQNFSDFMDVHLVGFLSYMTHFRDKGRRFEIGKQFVCFFFGSFLKSNELYCHIEPYVYGFLESTKN